MIKHRKVRSYLRIENDVTIDYYCYYTNKSDVYNLDKEDAKEGDLLETTSSKDTNTYLLKRKHNNLLSSQNTTSGNSITIPESSAPKETKLVESLQRFLYENYQIK